MENNIPCLLAKVSSLILVILLIGVTHLPSVFSFTARVVKQGIFFESSTFNAPRFYPTSSSVETVCQHAPLYNKRMRTTNRRFQLLATPESESSIEEEENIANSDTGSSSGNDSLEQMVKGVDNIDNRDIGSNIGDIGLKQMEKGVDNIVDDRVREEFAQKQIEIDRISVEEKKREINMKRLRFELMELRLALENSNEKTSEAKQRVLELEKKKEAEDLAKKSAVDKIKAQFSKEKDTVSGKIRKLFDRKERVKTRYLEDESRIKVQKEVKLLEDKVSSIESAVKNQSVMSEQAEEQINDVENEQVITIQKIQAESSQRIENIEASDTGDRLRLSRKTSRIQNKLAEAQEKLNSVLSERNYLKEAKDELEEKLQKTEFLYTSVKKDLAAKLEEQKSLNKKLSESTKQRRLNVSQIFARRLESRAKLMNEKLDEVRSEMEKKINTTKEAMKEQTRNILVEKDKELAVCNTISQNKMDAEKLKFDAMFLDLNEDMNRKRREVINDYTQKENEVKAKVEAEIEEIVLEKNAVISKIVAEKETILNAIESKEKKRCTVYKLEMTNKLIQMKEVKGDLEDDLLDRTKKIKKLKEEKESVRMLLKDLLKVGKQRTGRLTARLKRRKR